ncbi:hypothetical protein [Frankia sp. Cas3]|uniref:hypothetical protein n=1 Tax=Frankia sp. Cas3 TaxID=3073926 RepID=UPI002AD55B24|nr:hypothetical protein [Frankia sp. Cas3]
MMLLLVAAFGAIFVILVWMAYYTAKKILVAKAQPPDFAPTPAAMAVDGLAPGEPDVIQH